VRRECYKLAMPSPNGLFLLCTLIWGSTWFVIRFQLGTVAPEVSVVYRFTLAATLLLGFCAIRRVKLRFSRREHLLIAAQGAFMFGGNYVLTYHSERFLASGLVAVVFSLIVFFNIIGLRLFFAQPAAVEMLLGAACGVFGLALLFWPEFGHIGADTPKGLVIATLATLIAAIGNLIAAHNHRRGIPIQSSTGFAMLYGAMFVAIWALATGIPWSFLVTPAYLLSLAYLAVFGSILAFLSYLTLAGKIGVDRAGYVGVITPVVALGLSTLLEGYRWTLPAIVGAVLAMGGNVVILKKRAAVKANA
jgi:drug/metabolite transporter (DMT)-like permease